MQHQFGEKMENNAKNDQKNVLWCFKKKMRKQKDVHKIIQIRYEMNEILTKKL